MIKAREASFDEVVSVAKGLGVELPIEQTPVWFDYEATIEGRTPWGQVVLEDDGEPVAVMGLLDYETHGYHYLRAHHGPVWGSEPSAVEEREAIVALREHVRSKDRRPAFVRMAVKADLELCHPTLSTVPYDLTVLVDLTGGDDAILERMKKRGRRDVRKALRECPVECADETERATESFLEYYEVMLDTCERDGFAPAPITDYEDMIRILGPEHCRVYAGRLDGRLVTWSIDTIGETRATRYYGASLSGDMRAYATDKLCYFEFCDLGANKGCTTYDMMGIGSEFSPSIMGLNTFKTKFSQEVAPVSPDRDVPLKGAFYAALTSAKRLRDRLADRRGGRS